jgi:hypothetical protein
MKIECAAVLNIGTIPEANKIKNNCIGKSAGAARDVLSGAAERSSVRANQVRAGPRRWKWGSG